MKGLFKVVNEETNTTKHYRYFSTAIKEAFKLKNGYLQDENSEEKHIIVKNNKIKFIEKGV